MNLLDMRTVITAYGLSNLICTLVLGSLWLEHRRRSPEIGLWLADFAMQFVALTLITVRGAIPDFVSMVVANVLVVGGTVLLLMGLERYLGKRGPQVQNYVLLAVFTAVHTYYTLVQPSLQARNINMSLGLFLVSVQIVWLVWGRADAERRRVARPVALVMVAYAVLSLVRTVVDAAGVRTNDLFQSGLFDTAVLLSYQMLFIGLTFALVLMVNRRLFGELAKSEEKLSIAFHNVPDAILVATLDDGRIREASESFTRMTGLQREAVLGRTTVDIGLWDGTADRLRYVEALEATGRVLDFEALLRRASGEVFPAVLSGESIRIDGVPCVLTVIHDATESRRARDEILQLNAALEERVQERTEELFCANEELQSTNEELTRANSELADANDQLAEATRAKSDFLASMSHELRTPLNSIIGFAGVLGQGMAGDLNEEQHRQVAMIDHSGRHLLELINGVLDLAKIEAGDTRPTMERIDLCGVAAEALDSLTPAAQEKSLEPVLSCPDGPVFAVSDRLRVRQVLINLIGNAVKFSDRGRVTVSVARSGSDVAVTVADTGCGISPEHLDKVFEDFYQVTPIGGGKSTGTGLGLAVSRRLAESVGATIALESEPGVGSTFTLRLPVSG